MSIEKQVEEFNDSILDDFWTTEKGIELAGRIEKALNKALTKAHQAGRDEERERLRHLVCPCACDMFIDEDGYEEAHRGEQEALQDKK